MAKVWIEENGNVFFDCPNCGGCHDLPLQGSVAWGFNGDVEMPTLSPSVRCNFGNGKQCHFILTNGIMNVCGDDSFHPGQALALPDLPLSGEKV